MKIDGFREALPTVSERTVPRKEGLQVFVGSNYSLINKRAKTHLSYNNSTQNVRSNNDRKPSTWERSGSTILVGLDVQTSMSDYSRISYPKIQPLKKNGQKLPLINDIKTANPKNLGKNRLDVSEKIQCEGLFYLEGVAPNFYSQLNIFSRLYSELVNNAKYLHLKCGQDESFSIPLEISNYSGTLKHIQKSSGNSNYRI
jgi:hypothetical protein